MRRLSTFGCLTVALSVTACTGGSELSNSEPASTATASSAIDTLATETARAVKDPCSGCDDPERLIQRLGLQPAETPVRDLPGWGEIARVMIRADPELEARLAATAPGVEVVSVAGVAAARAEAEGIEALIGFPCDRELLTRANSLRWIQTPSAGVERCVANRDLLEGVLLTNAQRMHGPPLGEHAIALMLALSRDLDGYVRAQAEGRWSRDLESMWEVEGRTLHVVGLGGIGTEVAEKAHALGMRVTATRRRSREGPEFVDYVGLADEADTLIAAADVVVAAVPLTEETRGMFDAAFFAGMKRGALFINLGRGRSVVTEDLIAALESGRLGGAGLDVTDPEPLPVGHPLWSAPNVIITPHAGSGSTRTDRRFRTLAADNLRRYLAGEPMLSVVDLDRGY